MLGVNPEFPGVLVVIIRSLEEKFWHSAHLCQLAPTLERDEPDDCQEGSPGTSASKEICPRSGGGIKTAFFQGAKNGKTLLFTIAMRHCPEFDRPIHLRRIPPHVSATSQLHSQNAMTRVKLLKRAIAPCQLKTMPVKVSSLRFSEQSGELAPPATWQATAGSLTEMRETSLQPVSGRSN